MSAKRYLLLRYDTECPDERMDGFLETVLKIHISNEIPATLYCTGQTVEARKNDFHDFWNDAKETGIIDIQDHSYSHIGVCYENGPSLDSIRADYQRSFSIHHEVFDKYPLGIALCGVGDCGKRITDFGATHKCRMELAALANLKVKMLPSDVADTRAPFCSYAQYGYPDIMGFPSMKSDTDWFQGHDADDAYRSICKFLDEKAKNNCHAAIVFHDWCQWLFGPDKKLSMVRTIAQYARNNGFVLKTAAECYKEKSLWFGK